MLFQCALAQLHRELVVAAATLVCLEQMIDLHFAHKVAVVFFQERTPVEKVFLCSLVDGNLQRVIELLDQLRVGVDVAQAVKRLEHIE